MKKYRLPLILACMIGLSMPIFAQAEAEDDDFEE